MQVNTLAEEVPLVVILKAMGMTSDQEILQFLGTDEQSVRGTRVWSQCVWVHLCLHVLFSVAVCVCAFAAPTAF